MSKDYSSTLNLPKTAFSMKADLPRREPGMIAAYEDSRLYYELQKASSNRPLYILHDGPPFSNGNIHMGTSLNKILKDFIVKYKTMSGFRAPFIPGWDNHGMPIESAIIKASKLDRRSMPISVFRTKCAEFASNYVSVQRDQFRRLGVLGDWENPYLTMSPEFEAEEVRVFGEMYKRGYIYKGLKPVYWCPIDETALAEAEIEYSDDPCTSVYVKFAVTDKHGVSIPDGAKFVIWTTTPWTLPGNLAIALHPSERYAAIQLPKGNELPKEGEILIMAEALIGAVLRDAGVDSYEILSTYKGCELEFVKTAHPFLPRESVVVNAEYVTAESGTGCVHIAPGFGAEDAAVGRAYKLPILVSVDDRGYQTADAGDFAGMFYSKSDAAIVERMESDGTLLAKKSFTHSYPHCWRCKNPIIFRATPQWFCSVSDFREETVAAVENVEWTPSWGEERITQMVRDRADWCISRQRYWGLPIPVFYCSDCGKPVCDDATASAVSALFAAKGSNAWYDTESAEILPKGYKCPHCSGIHFTKETNTLDGWFDSGSTHAAVTMRRPELGQQADLYLEGADQYRGWFQSSLLTAIASSKEIPAAPYKKILTHGWVVDGQGHAMHKSIGNTVDPNDMVKKYGADLVRLWAASSDYQTDVRVSDEIFTGLSESYRKIRNTARIMLANLGDCGGDFDPDRDMVTIDRLFPIDRWILARLRGLTERVLSSYEAASFHTAAHDIVSFCTVELSKLYIDIIKDRAYVERRDGLPRRSAQTALYIALDTIVRLIAPVLTFTADELWQIMPHKCSDDRRHVLFNSLPTVASIPDYEKAAEWEKLFALRDTVMKSLELSRAGKLIGKSLEAAITIYPKENDAAHILTAFKNELESVFIVSKVKIVVDNVPSDAYSEAGDAVAVRVTLAEGVKCDRCWTVTKHPITDGEGTLCPRCAAVLNESR